MAERLGDRNVVDEILKIVDESGLSSSGFYEMEAGVLHQALIQRFWDMSWSEIHEALGVIQVSGFAFVTFPQDDSLGKLRLRANGLKHIKSYNQPNFIPVNGRYHLQ